MKHDETDGYADFVKYGSDDGLYYITFLIIVKLSSDTFFRRAGFTKSLISLRLGQHLQQQQTLTLMKSLSMNSSTTTSNYCVMLSFLIPSERRRMTLT